MTDATPNCDETDLIDALRQGDPAAFRRCFDLWYDELFAFAVRFAGSRDVAQDAVQDVFINVFRKRDALRVQGTLRAYLFGAVRNHLLKVVRHDRIVARVNQQVVKDRETILVPPAMGAPPSDPVRITEQEEIDRIVVQILTTLPERQRAAMSLRWNHGLTNTEIAEALSITKVAVGQLLIKAAAHIRRALPEF